MDVEISAGRALVNRRYIPSEPDFENLLESGADIQIKGEDGRTTTHTAAQGGYVRIVQRLRSLGLDINARTNDGSTPMRVAASNGHGSGQRRVIIYLHSLGTGLDKVSTRLLQPSTPRLGVGGRRVWCVIPEKTE